MKVAVVGTGRIGSAAAFMLLQQDFVKELIIVNRNPDIPEQLKMDFVSAFPEKGNRIVTGGFEAAHDADIILLTAGIFREKDLLEKNTKIMEAIFSKLTPKQEAKIIVVSAPPDPLAKRIAKLANLPYENVIAFGGELDINRLKYFVYADTGNFSQKVHAQFIGQHGANGIPLFSTPVNDRENVIENTTQFVDRYYTKVPASTFATAHEAVNLIRALNSETPTTLSISMYQKEQGLYSIWPHTVCKNGIVPLQMNLPENITEELYTRSKQRQKIED